MEKVIERIEKVKVGTTAKDIAADRRDFFLENVSESATVYFKEKRPAKKSQVEISR